MVTPQPGSQFMLFVWSVGDKNSRSATCFWWD